MRRKKKVGLFTKVLVVGFAGYATFAMVSLQMQISQKRRSRRSSRPRWKSRPCAMRRQKRFWKAITPNEYVARIAREKLGYVSPGERVFVDISSK